MAIECPCWTLLRNWNVNVSSIYGLRSDCEYKKKNVAKSLLPRISILRCASSFFFSHAYNIFYIKVYTRNLYDNQCFISSSFSLHGNIIWRKMCNSSFRICRLRWNLFFKRKFFFLLIFPSLQSFISEEEIF